MNIIMDQTLLDYMKEKNKKDIVVFTTRCNSWGGSYVEVSARFAEKNEKFDDVHYNTFDTEAGKLYLPKSSVRYGDQILLDRWKFLWMEGVRVSGVKAVA